MRNIALWLAAPVMAVALSSCASNLTPQEDRTIYFDFNKSTLNSAARTKLDTLATTLNNDKSIGGVNIVGYADRIGGDSYNEKLSEKRAENVKKYLAKKGYTYTSTGETRWVGESQSTTACGEKTNRESISCLSPDRKVVIEFHDVISEFCHHKNSRHCRQD